MLFYTFSGYIIYVLTLYMRSVSTVLLCEFVCICTYMGMCMYLCLYPILFNIYLIRFPKYKCSKAFYWLHICVLPCLSAWQPVFCPYDPAAPPICYSLLSMKRHAGGCGIISCYFWNICTILLILTLSFVVVSFPTHNCMYRVVKLLLTPARLPRARIRVGKCNSV